VNLRRSEYHRTMRIYDRCLSTPNFSRKILSVRLRQSFFFLSISRVIYSPNSSDPHFRVHGSSTIYHRPNIGARFSAVKDLPTDFRLDRCTGCPNSNVCKNAFLGRRSRAFRDPISARETSDVSDSSLYQRELQCYRLTFSYAANC